MSGRIIGFFFICLIGIPVAQVVTDRALGVGRLEIWDGHFDRHEVVTSKQRRTTEPGLHLHLNLHGTQRTG